MIERTFHPVPRMRAVLLEQIRIVGLAIRPAALVLGVVFGIMTILIGTAIVRGRAETWFDSGEWMPLAFVSFLFPFAVWRRDRRFAPSFLWTFPVDRRRLALAKVFAGWVWVTTAVAAIIVWHVVLALLAGVDDAETVPPIALAGTTAAYLFGSALVVGLRHALRWLLGGLGLIVLLAVFGDIIRGPDDVMALLPRLETASAIFVSIGAGLVALWAAVSRHAERRRH